MFKKMIKTTITLTIFYAFVLDLFTGVPVFASTVTPVNYATFNPWCNNGAQNIDVSDTEPGPVADSKTWKLVKTGSAFQWNGWEGTYNGLLTCNAGDYWTVSGYYKTNNAAGINNFSVGFYKANWSAPCNITVVESNLNIIADGNWHFFYCIMRANEAMYSPNIADGPSWPYSASAGVLYINGLQWTKSSYPVQYYNQTNLYKNYNPWNNGGSIQDVTYSEPGLISDSKTWKFTKTGGSYQWQGWEGNYNRTFTCNIGDYWTLSGYYKTSSAAGISKLHVDNFYKPDWSGPYNTIVIDSNTNIVADGKWHFFYCTIRANESIANAIIHDGPSWEYSTTAGVLYINDLRWTRHEPYYSTVNCATFNPWNNGGSIQDVSADPRQAGPDKDSKTWKFTKTGGYYQWQGWEGEYNGTFTCNPGECWTISGYYKTSNAAGIQNLSIAALYKTGWTGNYKTTILDADTTLYPDGLWHYFYAVIRADEPISNGIIVDGPSWNYSTSPGELYINGLKWIKSNNPFPLSFEYLTREMENPINLNYGEALQKAIFFYECQRSGKLPANKRMNWRGDSCLNDGASAGVDLIGGWYDSGDHVKFGMTIAYAAAMLCWAADENWAALNNAGQLNYLLDNIKWATDYLMKCYPQSNVFYYMVGNGAYDHTWWGPAETLDKVNTMSRPLYKADVTHPCASVVLNAAAALAAAARVFQATDPGYADRCLVYARNLYLFAKNNLSDAGYADREFYPLLSETKTAFYNYLVWADAWLYLATNDAAYAAEAEANFPNLPRIKDSSTIYYAWGQNWGAPYYGAALLMARVTQKTIFKDVIQNHLDYWTTGVGGNKVNYSNGGLACLSQWNTLAYATTTAFLASVYAKWTGCDPSRAANYNDFAKSQIDYVLGANGRITNNDPANPTYGGSYLVGYGTAPPRNPHHRDAHGSWLGTMEEPENCRHILYGALVGGPVPSTDYSSDDRYYNDAIDDYICNDVGCWQNAGLVGALAEMYRQYGGMVLANFQAMEPKTNEEFYVTAAIDPSDGSIVDAYINNCSGWPARSSDKLSFRYFFNAAGLSNPADIKFSYLGGEKVPVSAPILWQGTIYYVVFDFRGIPIFPGGRQNYRKEIKFRIDHPAGWTPQNDYSYAGLNNTLTPTDKMPVYDNGTLAGGVEPSK